MSLKVEFVKFDCHIEFNVTGYFGNQNMVKLFSKVFKKCKKYQLSKALIDFRPMKSNEDSIEKYIYGTRINHTYSEYLNKGASPLKIVFLTAHPSNKIKPGITIVQDNVLPFIRMENKDDALKWLNISIP